MTETLPADRPPLPPVGLRAAAWLGTALLVGMALLVFLLARDRADRSKLETTSQTTAVGDTAYLKHHSRDPAPELTLKGERLTPPSPRHIPLRDTKMVRAGETDTDHLHLYTASEPVPWEKGEIEDKNRPVYYLKVAPNEYLRVQ